jgi:RES domain-containing protein
LIPVYRLCKKQWADHAFDGEGARLYGGRWNSKGKSCVYAPSSESLAALEVLVHIRSPSILQHYSLIQCKLPKSAILKLGKNHLPKGWREEPAPPQTANLGDDWLDANISLALAVPSTIVPREFNYLLNPNHPDFNKMIEKAQTLDFSFDPRLFNNP